MTFRGTWSPLFGFVGHIEFDDLQMERRYRGRRAYRQFKPEVVMFTRELAGRPRWYRARSGSLLRIARQRAIRLKFRCGWSSRQDAGGRGLQQGQVPQRGKRGARYLLPLSGVPGTDDSG